jgi:hypothetical protein
VSGKSGAERGVVPKQPSSGARAAKEAFERD